MAIGVLHISKVCGGRDNTWYLWLTNKEILT
jgi:hypothetical protein